jgi:hypothetical protein
MATRIKRPPARLYEEDFYAWALEQARLLREERLGELDLDNLIEEVEGLARSERSAVLTNASLVLEHLLKLEHSPAKEPRNGWRATIREHRRRLTLGLTPRLQAVLADELAELYAGARADAAGALRDHGEDAAADSLPDTCPYTLDQILSDWLP